MPNYNTKNEILKKYYEEYLELDEGLSEQTIYSKLRDLRKYEEHTSFKCFSTFNKKQAGLFKGYYKKACNPTGETISASTILITFQNLKEFFTWLSRQKGYKTKINYDDLRIFNLTRKEENTARQVPYKNAPSLEHVKEAIHAMSLNSELERRNQALIAFALLTGARVQALISLRLGDVDEVNCIVRQNPKHVHTKFSKYIVTQFFEVGEDIQNIALSWVKHLRKKKGVSDNHPLFPASQGGFNAETQSFEIVGLSDRHITSTTTVREIFKEAYDPANLPYYKPHLLRDTLARHGERICKTPEQFKAWSQNLGHSSTLTTFNSYGEVHAHRQCELIKSLKE